MWIKFVSEKPYAIQLFVGSVNAVSGEPIVETNPTKLRQPRIDSKAVQDYMVLPEQKWIDGIAIAPGVVRQFVAMPVGSSYSIERQITGEESVAGISFLVRPRMVEICSRGIFERQKDLELHIRTLNSGTFTVHASSLDIIDDLKIRIEDQERICRSHQELILQRNKLEGMVDLTFLSR